MFLFYRVVDSFHQKRTTAGPSARFLHLNARAARNLRLARKGMRKDRSERFGNDREADHQDQTCDAPIRRLEPPAIAAIIAPLTISTSETERTFAVGTGQGGESMLRQSRALRGRTGTGGGRWEPFDSCRGVDEKQCQMTRLAAAVFDARCIQGNVESEA